MSKINFIILFYLSINLVSGQVDNKIYNLDVQANDSFNWVIDYPDNASLPFTNSEIRNNSYEFQS